MHYLIINSRFGSKLLAARLPRTPHMGTLVNDRNERNRHSLSDSILSTKKYILEISSMTDESLYYE